MATTLYGARPGEQTSRRSHRSRSSAGLVRGTLHFALTEEITLGGLRAQLTTSSSGCSAKASTARADALSPSDAVSAMKPKNSPAPASQSRHSISRPRPSPWPKSASLSHPCATWRRICSRLQPSGPARSTSSSSPIRCKRCPHRCAGPHTSAWPRSWRSEATCCSSRAPAAKTRKLKVALAPHRLGEIRSLSDHGLTELRFEDYLDAEEPPVRRFRAQFSRIAAV